MDYPQILSPIISFLHCPTPQAWIDEARKPENLPLLLTDHMVCELKAAQNAMLLVRRYVADKADADELLACLKPYEDFTYRRGPEPDFVTLHKRINNYARGLRREVRSHEPVMLIDKLICGAYIEARSCERFAALAPWLDDDLQKFYLSLLRSEARHYQDYLDLAQKIAGEDISERVRQLGEAEAALILRPEAEFRFHSGVPVAA